MGAVLQGRSEMRYVLAATRSAAGAQHSKGAAQQERSAAGAQRSEGGAKRAMSCALATTYELSVACGLPT